MGDFFHMSIEEADIAASLRAARQYLVHIHLADSNRQTPGLGHTQFLEPFRALDEIGFDGSGALKVRELPMEPMIETLGNYLFSRELLIVLDACEHLIEATALAAR